MSPNHFFAIRLFSDYFLCTVVTVHTCYKSLVKKHFFQEFLEKLGALAQVWFGIFSKFAACLWHLLPLSFPFHLSCAICYFCYSCEFC